MGSGACEVRALRCSLSPQEISTFSLDIFKFSNMQICFSACEQLNITKNKKSLSNVVSAVAGGVGGVSGFCPHRSENRL